MRSKLSLTTAGIDRSDAPISLGRTSAIFIPFQLRSYVTFSCFAILRIEYFCVNRDFAAPWYRGPIRHPEGRRNGRMSTATFNIFFGQALRAPKLSSSTIDSAGGNRVVEHANFPNWRRSFRAKTRHCGFEKYKVKVLTVAQCPYILT